MTPVIGFLVLVGLFVASLMWVHYRSRVRADIGTVLLKMGLLDERRLQEAVRIQQAGRMRLGEILVDMSFVTPEQMEIALRVQRLMRRGRPGEAMLNMVEYRTNVLHASLGAAHVK